MILLAAQKLSISNDILQHENTGLRDALTIEQKRRKRGKKMGIFAKKEPGQAVFVSPAKVAAPWIRGDDMEAQKVVAEQEKKHERAGEALEKEKRAQEAQER